MTVSGRTEVVQAHRGVAVCACVCVCGGGGRKDAKL